MLADNVDLMLLAPTTELIWRYDDDDDDDDDDV